MKIARRRAAAASAITLVLFCALDALAQRTPAENSPAPKPMRDQPSAARQNPQIIYRIGSRGTAEALHSQSKADMSLPVDANMPASLQSARSNANNEAQAAQNAAQAQQPGGPKAGKRAKKKRAHSTPAGNGADHGGNGPGRKHRDHSRR